MSPRRIASVARREPMIRLIVLNLLVARESRGADAYSAGWRAPAQPAPRTTWRAQSNKPWSRIEQALRVADLVLQAGGFAAIVLDMGSIASEHASRVPLATWFRYRAAAERTQAAMLLLAQHPCAKSSGAAITIARAFMRMPT